MGKRITVVLDDEVVKKLRILQSKKISKSVGSVSFSSVVNGELKKIIKEIQILFCFQILSIIEADFSHFWAQKVGFS